MEGFGWGMVATWRGLLVHSIAAASGRLISAPAPPWEQVRAVQRRIHELVGIPEQFGESIYVLRYALGQRYDQHNDNCAAVRRGGGRARGRRR